MRESQAAGAAAFEGAPAVRVDAPDRLAAALVDTASLIRVVPEKLRVAPVAEASPAAVSGLRTLLDGMTGKLDLPGIEVVPDSQQLWSVELALSRRLALRPEDVPGAAEGRDGAVPDTSRLGEAALDALDAFPGRPVTVPAFDGSPLRCWSVGPVDRPAVALVTACGMPVGLIARWMATLSRSFRVVTWESRGLFPADDGPGPAAMDGCGLPVQADDLRAVLDGFGIRQAHAMGLCGGAAIALAAAAHTDRVTSLSLWHGDYELGGEAPKTDHQRDVESMLTMAGRGRAQAGGLHKLLRRPGTLDGLRPDIAHHLIHPYATPELLHRYGLLNGAIMTTDCRPLLTAGQPAMVVTSPQDTTAHPAGSAYVAAHLPQAELRTMPDGDHLTAFDAGPELVALAEEFLHRMADPKRKDT